MSIYCDKCGEDIKDGITHKCSRQVDVFVSGNIYAAIEHIRAAITCLIDTTEDLIDNNDYRNVNARSHLNDALNLLNDGKLCR